MNELDEIEKLDDDISIWDAAFAAGLLVLNRNILAELNTLIDSLILRGRATTTAEWASNMRAITFFQAQFPVRIINLGFSDMLNGLIVNMGQSADRLNAYYGSILPDFDPTAYSTLITQLTGQTRTIVTNQMEATYSKVIGDVLTNSVMTRSTGAELRNALTAKLLDNGLSTKGVYTVASDSLYTFSRAYAQAVAEGLGLKHYYYMGTQIATTRSFCAARFGKAFTEAEVKSWADLTWTGKIPGTNSQTIFWYCGGFNCRHRIMPTSKGLYNQLNNSN